MNEWLAFDALSFYYRSWSLRKGMSMKSSLKPLQYCEEISLQLIKKIKKKIKLISITKKKRKKKILHLMSKVQIMRDYIPTLFLMVRSPLEY